MDYFIHRFFHRHDADTRRAWGLTFQFTSDHLSLEEARPLKFSYDVKGEEVLDILNEICPKEADQTTTKLGSKDERSVLEGEGEGGRNGIETGMGNDGGPRMKGDQGQEVMEKQQQQPNRQDSQKGDGPGIDGKKGASSEKDKGTSPPTKPTKPKRDLFVLLRDNRDKHPKLQSFWNEITTVPEWVDWEQIERGQDVFYRYGGACLTGLAFQSLLGGMGAARVVEVLARTGGFSVKVARHRLFETTQHILECTQSLSSIQAPTGAGFASSIRVRLLHAAVRQRIMNLTKTRPEYYSVEENGVPINDMDCVATIATFSATLIWLSLPRQGLLLRKQEIEDYVALWRLIAFYMGTPDTYFSSPTKAKAIMETLIMNEIRPTETGKVLAANIIRSLEHTPPAYTSRHMLEANARWLNGNELCDALGLGRPSWWYWMLMSGQCLFFMVICYTYRSVPYLDRRKIRAVKRIFWHLIVEGKFGLGGEPAVFDFKYVPEYGLNTARAGDEAERRRIYEEGLERRNLLTVVVVVGGLGVAGWFGLKITGMVTSWVTSLFI